MIKSDGVRQFATIETGDEYDPEALYVRLGDGRRRDCVWIPCPPEWSEDVAADVARMISREAVRYSGEVCGALAAIAAPRLNPSLIQGGDGS